MTKDHYQSLLERCRDIPAIPTAVVHPCDETSLIGAIEAAAEGLITPILIGPKSKIEAVAKEIGLDISRCIIEDTEHSHASAKLGVQLVREGKAELLMKGSLHSDELLHEVAAQGTGLRTSRRLSHIFAMNVPNYHKPLFVTDAAVNIFPTLKDKADICRNAIDVVKVLGVEKPKLALLSAVETITEKLPSTIEAAALVMMSKRGQITGGILDGPLAFDNAINKEAAKIKGIISEVAGDPDVLVAPDLEAGNILAKQLIYLAGAESAGIIVGARVPIIFTSRSDTPRGRITSCALGVLLAYAKHQALKID